ATERGERPRDHQARRAGRPAGDQDLHRLPRRRQGAGAAAVGRRSGRGMRAGVRGASGGEREYVRPEEPRRAARRRPRVPAAHRDPHRSANRDDLDRPRARRDDPGASSLPLTPASETRPTMALNVSWEQYNTLVERLALQVYESKWRFNQIICIARGGLRVGDVLSRIYELPLAILSTHSYTAEGGTMRGQLIIAEHMTMTAPRLGDVVLLVDD